MFDTLNVCSVYCLMVLKGLSPNFHTTVTATRRLGAGFVAVVALCALGGAGATMADSAAEPAAVWLAGRVLHQSAPVEQVHVYAIEDANEEWTRTETDANGHFLLEELAPGLYKLIAYKTGFVPAVLMLTRGERDEAQFVEIELGSLDSKDENNFWTARRNIPGDVLRDIEIATAESDQDSDGSIQDPIQPLRTQVQAFAGTDDRIGSAVSGGRVAVDGQFGDKRVALSGDFREFGSPRDELGSTQAMTVSVESQVSDVEVTTLRHDLAAASTTDAVALQRHAVGWSRDFGRAGHSQVRAQFTEQHGFYDAGGLGPMAPDASRAFELLAEYTAELTESHFLTAGINYRETESLPESINPGLETGQRIDIYSEGGVQVQPRVLVQYGLVTTLRDGVVSFVPRGGAVLRLGDRWKASTLVAQRVYSEDETGVLAFRPVMAESYNGCQSGQSSCYQIELARQVGDDRHFSVAASHREFDETLQLFFDEDLLDRLDTVYLVAGDQLPELAVSYSTYWTPGIRSRVESSLAVGGGGQVMTVGDPMAENRVRYLVTSLDTYFERSDTGVYVALQQLQQSIQGRQLTPLDLDKLQLRLTQDLKSLVQMADVAVSLNYELARGAHPGEPDRPEDEVRQRLTGGVALSF